MKKAILIIIGVIVFGYVAFICEESIRLRNNSEAQPLIVLDKVFCSKDHWVCYGSDREYKENYISLGFSLKREYILEPDATKENHKYHLAGEEFWLFGKFLIWGWIS